jgi:hypothetical protein
MLYMESATCERTLVIQSTLIPGNSCASLNSPPCCSLTFASALVIDRLGLGHFAVFEGRGPISNSDMPALINSDL